MEADSQLPSVARFAGVTELYDSFRPPPPDVLAAILAGYTGNDAPGLVVDLGCGTGLSTRYWADRAQEVVGIDPSAEMLRHAIKVTHSPNVSYRLALARETGLADGCADVVLCANALHWMEPLPTFAEVARLLRPNGVFAAYYDNQYPSTLNWEADKLLHEFRGHVIALEAKVGTTAGARRSCRENHLTDMQTSGHFRFAREISVHQTDIGNTDRLIGLALCDGFVRSLLKAGIRDADIGLDAFRAEANRILGNEQRPWLWTVNLWIGVK
jgi:SAM-dependent methyltransferase